MLLRGALLVLGTGRSISVASSMLHQDPMSNQNSIESSSLGGATSIGASCTLVRVAGRAFVVDCGVRYSRSSPLPDLPVNA